MDLRRKVALTLGVLSFTLAVIFALLYIQSLAVMIYYSNDFFADGEQYIVSLNRTEAVFNDVMFFLSYICLFIGFVLVTTSIFLQNKTIKNDKDN